MKRTVFAQGPGQLNTDVSMFRRFDVSQQLICTLFLQKEEIESESMVGDTDTVFWTVSSVVS
eukprot:scaffold306778_cov51-Attheya_sp.AAC.1